MKTKYTISEIKQLIRTSISNKKANVKKREDMLNIALRSGDKKRIEKARANLNFEKNNDWHDFVRTIIKIGKCVVKEEPPPKYPDIRNYNGFCGYLDDLEIYWDYWDNI